MIAFVRKHWAELALCAVLVGVLAWFTATADAGSRRFVASPTMEVFRTRVPATHHLHVTVESRVRHLHVRRVSDCRLRFRGGSLRVNTDTCTRRRLVARYHTKHGLRVFRLEWHR